MRVACLLLVLPFTACQIDQGVGQVKDTDAGEGAPEILIEPDALYFSTLDLGQEEIQPFTITNIGDADLHISAMQYFGASAFAVQATESAPDLAPGESVTVNVRFSPVGPEDRGEIHILNDSVGSPEPLVHVEGTGRLPELLISPDPLDFGNILIGCSRTEPIRLTNTGDAPLVVSSVAEVGEGFELGDFVLPITILPGAYSELPLTLTPLTDTYYTSQLFVAANTAIGTHAADQDGAGTYDPDGEQEFWQGDGPWEQADILFYVDQSCSMRDNKAILTANFESFASRLESLDVDWQVGVAVRDTGCLSKGILTPDTPSLIETFTDAVSGWAGDATEMGFTVTDQALSESRSGGCNEGLIRPGAKTTIILVSDEVEQSGMSWTTYLDRVWAIAPTATITSIVGDYPDGCITADPGDGYFQATVGSGGAFLSICASDWSPYFETIATMTASGQLDTFVLTSEPDPVTVTVSVDDLPAVEGWTYDAVVNGVVFDTNHVPEPGAHIVVRYALAGDCEG